MLEGINNILQKLIDCKSLFSIFFLMCKFWYDVKTQKWCVLSTLNAMNA
jgi:hypothetical protein